ncbi:MAG: DUF883 domain-containing protein [Sphingomonadales bacterium]|nr:DUF883 domain-containing protein [Sphingomonadales bacterium]
METTYETTGRGRPRETNGETVREQASKVSGEFSNLIADVEDLVKKVANVGDAEVARVRARVEKTLANAKAAAVNGASTVKGYARHATVATDEYVHESPWTAVGLAAAVGVLIGFFASRR